MVSSRAVSTAEKCPACRQHAVHLRRLDGDRSFIAPLDDAEEGAYRLIADDGAMHQKRPVLQWLLRYENGQECSAL
jgi:hypothetical protein